MQFPRRSSLISKSSRDKLPYALWIFWGSNAARWSNLTSKMSVSDQGKVLTPGYG